MKTRTVTFTYGTVKNASLKVPAEDFSIMNVVDLIRESYFDYTFRDGCGLMSDACLTSSIGQANFFAGALGGYKTRLPAEMFVKVKELLECVTSQAMAVARRRSPGATLNELYARASENDALSESDRAMFARFAKHDFKL